MRGCKFSPHAARGHVQGLMQSKEGVFADGIYTIHGAYQAIQLCDLHQQRQVQDPCCSSAVVKLGQVLWLC
jgi:hypothetical protein